MSSPSPRPPRPRRPDRIRLAHRLAAGLPPARAAEAERVPEAEVEALAAEPAFGRLVEACRRLDALPHAERVERLLKLAVMCLERAVRDGDPRVAFFVVRECHRGRDPSRTLAEGVVRAQARAVRPPAATASPARPVPAASPGPHRPRDPEARAAAGAAARMRREVAREELLREDAEPAMPRAAPAPALAARPVHTPAFLERRTGCATALAVCRRAVHPGRTAPGLAAHAPRAGPPGA